MSRYTFHVVWLLITFAGILSLYRGPLWGYPIAIFLAFVFSICVAGYPTDRSLRRTLGGFGALLVAGGAVGISQAGVNPVSVHSSVPLVLFGFAFMWSAVVPWTEIEIHSTVTKTIPRTYPDNGPPCPQCSRPLRTPNSLQCFHCGADWHGTPESGG